MLDIALKVAKTSFYFSPKFTSYEKKTSFDVGDHLVINHLTYSHHGIYVGNGRVIERTREGVRDSSMAVFREGAPSWAEIGVVPHHDRKYSRKNSVSRAKSRLGDDDYNVIFNNCEHFVNWCIEGISQSDQVDNAMMAGLRGVESCWKTFQRKGLDSAPEVVSALMQKTAVNTTSSIAAHSIASSSAASTASTVGKVVVAGGGGVIAGTTAATVAGSTALTVSGIAAAPIVAPLAIGVAVFAGLCSLFDD